MTFLRSLSVVLVVSVAMFGCKKKDEGAADAEADAEATTEVDAEADAQVAVEEDAGADATTAPLAKPTVVAAPTASVSAATLALCARAGLARDRGSPAGPGLEKQCLAAGGTMPAAAGAAGTAAPAATPVAPAPKAGAPEPAVCAKARAAAEKGSPAAAGLAAQCRAAGGTP
ncbi:MAG: hypothetical protein KF819_40995 [Labilithrix sp.]|nr:hypothetical protein [Labilithrix sp.]